MTDMCNRPQADRPTSMKCTGVLEQKLSCFALSAVAKVNWRFNPKEAMSLLIFEPVQRFLVSTYGSFVDYKRECKIIYPHSRKKSAGYLKKTVMILSTHHAVEHARPSDINSSWFYFQAKQNINILENNGYCLKKSLLII